MVRTNGVSTITISIFKYVSITASSQPIRKSSREKDKYSQHLWDGENWQVRETLSLLALRNDVNAVREAVASTNGDIAC